MIVEGYEFSKSIDNLYNEVLSLNPNREIKISIKDNIEVGYGTYNANGEIDTVEVDKKYASDDILSHEMLHCYLYRKGYTKVRTYCSDGDIIYYFALHIENNLMHKLIYEEQKRRNINTYQSQLYFAKTLGTNIDKEPNNFKLQIIFSMKILDAEIRCSECKEVYQERIMNNFSNSYKFAKRIYDAAMKYDFQNQFDFRRALIRAFKEIDNIIEENGLPKLNLNHNIGVDFIPSRNQLEVYLDQLFDLYENAIIDNDTGTPRSILVSKSENQACYFIKTDNIEEFKRRMSSMTLRECYNITGWKYVVR